MTTQHEVSIKHFLCEEPTHRQCFVLNRESDMTKQKVRFFSLLLVILFSVTLLILSQEQLTGNISRTVFSGYNRVEGGLFKMGKFWKIKGASIPSQKTKTDVASGRNVMREAPPADTPMPILSLNSFQKRPLWDFEDIYNQDAPPKPTTCPQSLHNSKDEAFQKAFLPNIRLFQHKDNFNMKDWNRLSHFNNPFGFMGMKYSDVSAAVKLIPKPKEPMLPPGSDGCVHCAVVANGGILNGSKMGAEIDAHDYVFRMNGAVTKGYEEDVGKKTSVYVHTSFSITQSIIIFEEFGYKSAPYDEGIKYLLIPEGLRDFWWLEALFKGKRVSAGEFENEDARSYYSGKFNESNFYVLHQDFLRYVQNRFLKSDFLNDDMWAIVRPTNGAFTLFLALHTCDTVSAYGFMTENYYEFSNYYVEKHQKSEVVFYANHDLIQEKDLWKSLHNRKILKLHQRP